MDGNPSYPNVNRGTEAVRRSFSREAAETRERAFDAKGARGVWTEFRCEVEVTVGEQCSRAESITSKPALCGDILRLLPDLRDSCRRL